LDSYFEPTFVALELIRPTALIQIARFTPPLPAQHTAARAAWKQNLTLN
jgi:hypothetical protein